MPIDLSVVGTSLPDTEVTWTETDSMLYNLGVGAGQSDALSELSLTTENSEGHTLQVVPSFGVVLIQSHMARPYFGEYHLSKQLHAEQRFRAYRPLPPSGRATMTSVVSGIYDKGSGALAIVDSTIRDAESGDVVYESQLSAFIVGEGGFGGPKTPAEEWEAAVGPPDLDVPLDIPPNQALLYRLCGDRNPLHSDPLFARRAGFERPILHGLCTYGTACRIMMNEFCGGTSARIRALSSRFVKPVLPGEELRLVAWSGESVTFRVLNSAGVAVLDRGRMDISTEDSIPEQES